MKIPPIFLIALGFAPTAHAATLLDDFSGDLGQWDTIGSVSITPTGNPGGALEAAAGGANYITSTLTLDAREDISGSFDFYVFENGNYSNAAFWLGDASGSSAGDAIRVDLREKTFGARANILDANGTTLFDGSGNNLYEIATNTWYSASFTWIAATGDFSFSWGGTEGPMTVSGYNFNSDALNLSFGTTDDSGRFDNINITGTAYVIPEPRIPMLLGSLGMLLLYRRKR